MTESPPQIVVVDDSPTSILLYELSAGPLEVMLHSFRSPLDSLLHLEAHTADLLFLDIIMREMDGLTLLKKLRDMDLHQDTPVVIVTSKDYAQDRSTAMQLGARDFLVKPLKSQEIREIICKYTGAEEKTEAAN